MLGPLKFGLQTKGLVKSATTGDYELIFDTNGAETNPYGYTPALGTISASEVVSIVSGTAIYYNSTDFGKTKSIISLFSSYYNPRNIVPLKISGKNTTTSLFIRAVASGTYSVQGPYPSGYFTFSAANTKITSISGSFPADLNSLDIGFNFENPTWTIPNIPTFSFLGSGPSSLTFGSNFTTITTYPTNLTTLNLRACIGLTSLPTIPVGLINLTTPPNITIVNNLPPSLKTLDFSTSTKITALYLSSGLTGFSAPSSGLGVTGIDLPSGLRELSLKNFSRLTSLPALPLGLVKIDLSGCEQLSRLPGLTGLTGLIELNLSNCSRLTTLPTLPSTLQTLILKSCKVAVPVLNSNLRKFSAPVGITGLAGITSNLTELELFECNKLTNINLSGFSGISSLIIPTSGTTVDLTGCSSLTTLTLSPNTTTLNLSGCIKLPLLHNLPSTLTTLNMSGCTGMTGVLNYPVNLTSLIMKNCDGIIEITGPSKSKLTTLDISDCDTIRILTIPPSLTSLRIDNCGITGIDLRGTNVSTLNITPNMFSRLTHVNLTGGKLNVSGLLRYNKPRFSNWTLY